MILLLSGEGPTDLGQSSRGGSCWGDEFQPGPMARLIEQILEPCLSLQIIESARQDDSRWIYFLAKADLIQKAKVVKSPKSLFLTGTETVRGTLFHRKAAYALGIYAQELEEQNKDDLVMAVMFRDSDGTQSCPRTDWQDKRDSIEKGFEAARFDGGVAMIPKPKSEAWLLCALRENYQHCELLEAESGNDDSQNPLKAQLSQHLGYDANAEQLSDMVVEERIIARQINMPSFVAFWDSLVKAAQYSKLDISTFR